MDFSKQREEAKRVCPPLAKCMQTSVRDGPTRDNCCENRISVLSYSVTRFSTSIFAQQTKTVFNAKTVGQLFSQRF